MGSTTEGADPPEVQHIKDAYRHPGFRPLARVHRHPSDDSARVITLVRRGKKGGLRLLRHRPFLPL